MGEKVERVRLGAPPEMIATFKAENIAEYEEVNHMLDTTNMVLGIDR
jgi:hypothetical protein